MATSLSQQLQRLAVPQTYTLSQDKKKPSLLFDAKDAANYDRDTIFCIGVNGLEELGLIDSSFQEFEENLFSETAKSFVRSIQTSEVNKKLDETISDFLHRVSPFALLRAAHKALEWLIHRFHIHLYNSNALVACFLPYHGTNIFVRVVQLLDLRQSIHPWHWLKSVQDSGVALTKSAIINYAIRNLGFLKFICEMATPAIKEKDATKSSRYQTLFSFYASTVVGVLHETETIKEEVISQLLPYILSGLKSASPHAKCTSYIIIAQLTSKARLKEDLCEALVNKIIQSTHPDCKQEVLMCLAAVYQQQPYDTFPMASVTHGPFLNNLTEDISTLAERNNIDKLLSVVVPSTTKAALCSYKPLRKKNKITVFSSRFQSLTIDLIRTLCLPDDVVKQVISLLLSAYTIALKKRKETVGKTALSSFVGNLLFDLETRYPNIFDTEVEERSEKLSRQCNVSVNDIVNVLLQEANVKHTSVSDTRLFLSLNHPKRQLRTAAVKALMNAVNTAEGVACQGYICDALIGRLLSDDSHLVVYAILKRWEVLQQLMSADALLDALTKVLQTQRINKEKWRKVILNIIRIICDVNFYSKLSEDAQHRATIFLFPFLLPTEPADLPYVTEIYENYEENVLFAGIYKELKKHIDNAASPFGLSNLCVCTITAFSKRLMQQSEIRRLVVIQNIIDASSVKSPWRSRYRFLALGFITQLIVEEKDEQRKLILAKISLLFIFECLAETSPSRTTCNMVVPIEYDSPSDLRPVIDCCLKEVAKGMMPFEAVALTMKNLIQYVQLPRFLSDQKWWQASTGNSLQDEYVAIQVKIFDFITNQTKVTPVRKKKNFRLLMKLFVQTNCPKMEQLIHFLMMMGGSGSDDEVISRPCQAKALNVMSAVLQSTPGDLQWTLEAQSTIVPSLLVALNSPYQPIRKLVLDCFQELAKQQPGNFMYSNLTETLSKHREEIELDVTQFPQLLGTYFTEEHGKRNSRRSHQHGVLDLLIGYIVCDTTPAEICCGLLHCLAMVKTEELLQKTLPLFERLVSKLESGTITARESSIVELLLKRFTPDKALFIGDKDDIFSLLKNSLLIPLTLPGLEVTCQQLTMRQITKEFFAELPADSRRQILTIIIDLMVDSPSAAMKLEVSRVFRKIYLEASQIIYELDKFTQQPGAVPKTLRKGKRRRSSQPAVETSRDVLLDSRDWRRLECMLEMLQSKKKINNVHLLVPVLFALLKRLLESERPDANEYVKQLALSCIHHCCLKLSSDQGETIPSDILNESQLNVELVVQCLRVSGDPQTHNHALLLLGIIAKLFPEHVLHNTMAIFTFMGTSLLRQDDRFSFMIMARTIQAIIPAITKASFKDDELNPEAEKVIILVLRIFVDAFPDIPAHRRLPVFLQLLQTLNATLFLGAAIGLLMEHNVASGRSNPRPSEVANAPTGNKDTDQLSLPVQFALDLSSQFAPADQVRACIRLVKFLQSLPTEKDEKSKMQSKRKRAPEDEAHQTLFDISSHSAKELRHFKYVCVVFVSALLSSKPFIRQIAELEDRKTQSMEPLYQSLLNETLKYSNHVAHAAEDFSQKPSAKFWKTMNHKTYDILDKVNSLLPTKTFIGVISGLMESELSIVRRKAMELLNSRLQQQPDVFREENAFLLSLIDPLLMVVKKKVKSNADKEDMAVNKQMALLSLKVICRLLGHEPIEPLKQVLEAAVKSFTVNLSNTALCANSLLCIVELCSCLRAHSITYLHKFMPGVVELLQDQSRLKSHELLLLSVVTAVHRLTEILPNFLSPYVQHMLTEICIIATTNTSNPKSPISLRLKAIRHNMATLIPIRVVLPVIRSCHDELLTKCPDAIENLMLVLNEAIAQMTTEDRTSYLSELTKFFLDALDYRTQHQEESLDKIASMESYIMEPFLTVVMKLSEVTFRPLFLKLFNWATSEEAPAARSISFYCLAGKIAEKLKSLFVLFAGPIVKHAATLLVKHSNTKDKASFDDNGVTLQSHACHLLELMLDCLCKCFLYDSEGFVNQERFDTLMQPLVNQIENDVVGTEDAYKARIVDHLAPCIAQFAVAAADDASWKQLNYQILLKTRHSSPRIRFSALQVVQELTRRLGKDYLPILPETIPFLAELMEDESSEVEQQCQTVIADMESILGESLQKYF